MDQLLVLVGLLLLLVFLGVHVAVALGVTSIAGVFIQTGSVDITLFFLNSTAYESLRNYLFAVIPLFMLMGEFISRSGLATDIFRSVNSLLRAVPGRIAHATVLGNVLFAFVTGTSLASASAFTSIAYPEMRRLNYNPSFSLGLITGSACIGMLIPPSILMVVWGILTNQSIGALFLAGILPGIVVAVLMLVYIAVVAIMRPDIVGMSPARRSLSAAATAPPPSGESSVKSPVLSAIGFLAIIAGSLGGIWTGVFTPTEGAGVGAVISLVVGILRGMRLREIYAAILAVGRSAGPIMLILFAAQLYSRTLAMTGLGSAIQGAMLGLELGPYGIIALMILIWFVMGMLLDSLSIMLLTVPIFHPIAVALGLEPLAFAVIGILAIEAGLLTPPFGILVFAVKAVANDPNVTLGDVFRGSVPLWLILLAVIALLLMVPEVATLLPSNL